MKSIFVCVLLQNLSTSFRQLPSIAFAQHNPVIDLCSEIRTTRSRIVLADVRLLFLFDSLRKLELLKIKSIPYVIRAVARWRIVGNFRERWRLREAHKTKDEARGNLLRHECEAAICVGKVQRSRIVLCSLLQLKIRFDIKIILLKISSRFAEKQQTRFFGELR